MGFKDKYRRGKLRAKVCKQSLKGPGFDTLTALSYERTASRGLSFTSIIVEVTHQQVSDRTQSDFIRNKTMSLPSELDSESGFIGFRGGIGFEGVNCLLIGSVSCSPLLEESEESDVGGFNWLTEGPGSSLSSELSEDKGFFLVGVGLAGTDAGVSSFVILASGSDSSELELAPSGNRT